jgi:hypothetical protein
MCGITINPHRPQHTAFEVPAECGTTKYGIVDAVRISEYFSGIENRYACFWQLRKGDGIQQAEQDRHCIGGYKVADRPRYCNQPGCVWKHMVGEGDPDILITCFEIKISTADFKSANGHNFVGNLNYYVVPVPLLSEVKDVAPEGIGIIAYYDGTQKTGKDIYGNIATAYVGLRRKKECVYRPLSHETQKWMILSAMKRIPFASQ